MQKWRGLVRFWGALAAAGAATPLVEGEPACGMEYVRLFFGEMHAVCFAASHGVSTLPIRKGLLKTVVNSTQWTSTLPNLLKHLRSSSESSPFDHWGGTLGWWNFGLIQNQRVLYGHVFGEEKWFPEIRNHWGDRGAARNWWLGSATFPCWLPIHGFNLNICFFSEIDSFHWLTFMQDFRKKVLQIPNKNHGDPLGRGPGVNLRSPEIVCAFASQLTRVTWPSRTGDLPSRWIQNPGGEVTSSLFGKCCEPLFGCLLCVRGVLNHTESTLLMLEKMRYIRYTCHPVESDTWNSYDVWWDKSPRISEVSRVAPSLHRWGDFLTQNQQLKLMDHGGVSIGRDWVSNSW